MIPAYIDDELESGELKEFLDHIDSCPDCKEELAIQFLITEGLNTLNSGDSYDLQSSMDEKMIRSHREIHISNRLFWVRNTGVVLVFAMAIVLGFIIYSFLF